MSEASKLTLQQRLNNLRIMAQQKTQLEQSVEQLDEIINSEQAALDMEQDYETFERLQKEVRVATYEVWRMYGRTVRRGEKARKINNVAVFHITQTSPLHD